MIIHKGDTDLAYEISPMYRESRARALRRARSAQPAVVALAAAFVAEIGWWIVLVLGGLSLLLYFMEVWEYGGAWVAVMYFLGMASVFILCGLLGRFLRMLICG